MSPLSWTAVAVALTAVLGLGLGLPDRWFCALLAFACLLGSADAAYRELGVWAVTFLFTGLMLTGAAAHAAYTAGRDRRQQ